MYSGNMKMEEAKAYMGRDMRFPTMWYVRPNVGHFGHGHFGLGRFGLDISATDVSATENAKGGRFGQNHNLWVGVCACINV